MAKKENYNEMLNLLESTIETLENNDLSLIEDNGYTIYYDASANSWLNGQTITLSNGGTLTPIK